MATAPKPPPKSEPKPEPKPPAPEAETVADEQRRRSDEIAAMGVEKYKREVMDGRSEDEKEPRQVEGVTRPRDERHEASRR